MNQSFARGIVAQDGVKTLEQLRTLLPGLRTVKVASIRKSGRRRDVWDVSLRDNSKGLPYSIITNGVVTHNSSDPHYYSGALSNYFGGKLTASDIFGTDSKPGRLRLYHESVGEAFFDSMSSLLREMPDKVYVDKEWWYCYDNTNANRKLVGSKYNKKKFSEWNKFYVPCDSGGIPQALLLLDSYPYMYPEALDEDDKGAGMAAVARMFSANIPKLAPKLKRKSVIVLGVNQLRQRPAAYGDPFYEPAGEAIRYTSQLRIRSTSRAIPHGKGQLEDEDSVFVDGGKDTYRYIVQKIAKNKTGGIPQAEAWQRIWVSDAEGKARGIDPVWDCYQYLLLTGQIDGPLKKLRCTVPGMPSTIAWWDFKALVLLRGSALRDHCATLKLDKNPKLVEFCRKQLESGEAFTLYSDAQQGLDEEEGDEEGDDE